MARPLRIQFPGACYHITARGIERRRIYGDEEDRRKFVGLLTGSLATYQVALHAYILMDNHYHLVIQTRKANCSEFMRHFNICYTGYFNWRYRRCGSLYQGRYHAFLVDADRHLLEVSRYLHLDSVRAKGQRSRDYRGLWRRARDYQWSSLGGYVNERLVVRYVNYGLILSMIGGRSAYRAFMVDGLKRDLEDPFKNVTDRFILGDNDFVAEVKHQLKRGSTREQPAYRSMVARTVEPEVLLGMLARELGVSRESLGRRRANGVARGMAAELLYKYGAVTRTEIGRWLGGIDYVSVHQLRRRARQKMHDDKGLANRYREIDAEIKRLCNM